jgi:hypothetical protein
MCKPAGETANVTYYESHTTRARAMLLWRVLKGMADYSERDVELLYETTLDSVSEAWCVNHYPVSKYLLAARQALVKAGRIPGSVKSVLGRKEALITDSIGKGEVVFVGADTDQTGSRDHALRYRRVMERLGIEGRLVVGSLGLVGHSLGDVEGAAAAAERMAAEINAAQPKRIVADSQDTFYALTRLFPEWGISLPGGVEVVSLAEYCSTMEKRAGARALEGKKVFVHDSRACVALADKLPSDEVIQPGFAGPEEALGTGRVYDDLRMIVDRSGGKRVFSVWSRCMSKTSGADDGLALTCPAIARRLASCRFQQAQAAGAETVVTDSLAAVTLWESLSADERKGLSFAWWPEIL